jgi:hypothetical protein
VFDNHHKIKGGVSMKSKFFFFGILLLVFFSRSFAGGREEKKSRAGEGFCVEKRWATEQVLKIPESVKYDVNNDRIYVANINGRSNKKDGNGFISIVSTEGEIVELKWIEGLNAPKGMGIYQGKLYVADIDEVVEISIKDGKIMESYKAEGAEFLNDIDVDSHGNVYISDSSGGNSVIYRLSGGKIEVWLKSDEIDHPNGLYVKDSLLVVGNSGDGKLKAVRIKDRSVEVIADVGSGIDGVEVSNEGNFIISDWRGKTRLVEPGGAITVLRDTSEEKINSADIEFVREKNLILIPTFMDNRVVAVELKKVSHM